MAPSVELSAHHLTGEGGGDKFFRCLFGRIRHTLVMRGRGRGGGVVSGGALCVLSLSLWQARWLVALVLLRFINFLLTSR